MPRISSKCDCCICRGIIETSILYVDLWSRLTPVGRNQPPYSHIFESFVLYFFRARKSRQSQRRMSTNTLYCLQSYNRFRGMSNIILNCTWSINIGNTTVYNIVHRGRIFIFNCKFFVWCKVMSKKKKHWFQSVWWTRIRLVWFTWDGAAVICCHQKLDFSLLRSFRFIQYTVSYDSVSHRIYSFSSGVNCCFFSLSICLRLHLTISFTSKLFSFSNNLVHNLLFNDDLMHHITSITIVIFFQRLWFLCEPFLIMLLYPINRTKQWICGERELRSSTLYKCNIFSYICHTQKCIFCASFGLRFASARSNEWSESWGIYFYTKVQSHVNNCAHTHRRRKQFKFIVFCKRIQSFINDQFVCNIIGDFPFQFIVCFPHWFIWISHVVLLIIMSEVLFLLCWEKNYSFIVMYWFDMGSASCSVVAHSLKFWTCFACIHSLSQRSFYVCAES